MFRSCAFVRATWPKVCRRMPLGLIALLGPSIAAEAPIGPLLVPVLEARFARPNPETFTRIDGIIALGGSPERMIEAVRLAKLYPESKLVISGRGEEKWHVYARANGIPSIRLVIECQSRTTYENAMFSSAAVQPKTGEKWLLVTSASHMPRAVGSFRKAGFSVLAWPVMNAPDKQRFAFAIARHEWLGLFAYRILGRTDDLLPGLAQNPENGTQLAEARDPA